MKAAKIFLKEDGKVKEVRQGIVKVTGFSYCARGQIVKFGYDTMGMIIGFNQDETSVLLLKEREKIRAGDKAVSYLKDFTIPVGSGCLGRIVNALGEPSQGGSIEPKEHYPVFRQAPSLLDRVPIQETLETGLKIVDMLTPLGNGQRQLIIGDRLTGKTSVATDIILSQKDKEVICIYCFVGKTESSLLNVIELFNQKQAFDYTVIVSAPAYSSIGQQYLAPYAACALGEYFMHKGRKVLVVFDDLTKHAWIYRQISLLLDRPPGRDAYPGDIFYIHSQLMERAAKLSREKLGGSMTFLPIIETLQGDVTGYISSNLISMTDGQIYLSSDLFKEGFKPAIDLGLSVSRIGSKAQWPAIRELSAGLRLEYLRYKEEERLMRMNLRLSEELEVRLRRGQILYELLKQNRGSPISLSEQVVLFYAYQQGLLDNLSLEKLRLAKKELFAFLNCRTTELINEIKEKKELTSQIKEKLDTILKEYFSQRPISH